MIALEQAQEQVLQRVRPLPPEPRPLAAALGRFLAANLSSEHELPPFDNSAMDGYAVRAEDLRDASAETPVRLQLAGRTPAGQPWTGELQPGECVRIFTGSPLPKGADAVVMQEDTCIDPANPDRPCILAKVTPWENVRFRGEDVKAGTALVPAGERLTASHMGLLAALGISTVPVGQQPVLGLVATGNELREPGEKLAPGQIFESNRMSLSALAREAGALTRIYPLVKDDLTHTQAILATALRECHAVVTSGGISVGEMDCVKEAFQQLGGELAFWRVAIKPGKPFAFGTCQGKLLFGLPGNPVSAFVTFLLLVRPAVLGFQGAARTNLPTSPGVLAEGLSNPGDRRHFVRVIQTSDGEVRSAGTQASHLLHSLAHANGLVDLPPGGSLPVRSPVAVLRWA
jgi:molybdopterin molybdotransferase